MVVLSKGKSLASWHVMGNTSWQNFSCRTISLQSCIERSSPTELITTQQQPIIYTLWSGDESHPNGNVPVSTWWFHEQHKAFETDSIMLYDLGWPQGYNAYYGIIMSLLWKEYFDNEATVCCIDCIYTSTYAYVCSSAAYVIKMYYLLI